MAYTSIENALKINNVEKKKYEDVGVYGGVKSDRMKIFLSSRDILNKVNSYRVHLSKCGVGCKVLADVDDSKLFWLDGLYFKFCNGIDYLEVSINLKESFNYKLLYSSLNNGDSSLKESLLDLYKGFWSDALYSVFLKSDVDCEYFLWSALW